MCSVAFFFQLSRFSVWLSFFLSHHCSPQSPDQFHQCHLFHPLYKQVCRPHSPVRSSSTNTSELQYFPALYSWTWLGVFWTCFLTWPWPSGPSLVLWVTLTLLMNLKLIIDFWFLYLVFRIWIAYLDWTFGLNFRLCIRTFWPVFPDVLTLQTHWVTCLSDYVYCILDFGYWIGFRTWYRSLWYLLVLTLLSFWLRL